MRRYYLKVSYNFTRIYGGQEKKNKNSFLLNTNTQTLNDLIINFNSRFKCAWTEIQLIKHT